MLNICEYVYLITPFVLLFLLCVITYSYIFGRKRPKLIRLYIYCCVVIIVLYSISTSIIIYTLNRYGDSNVEFGMTQSEVLKLLGEPYITRSLSQSSERWWYIIHVKPLKYNIDITFDDGVVIGMGESSDETLEALD